MIYTKIILITCLFPFYVIFFDNVFCYFFVLLWDKALSKQKAFPSSWTSQGFCAWIQSIFPRIQFCLFSREVTFSLCHLFIKQRLYWSHPSTHFLIFTCLFSLLHRAGVCFVHQSNVLCDILVIGLFIECVICKLQEMQNNSWRKSFVYCDVYHTISLSEEQKNIG